MKILLIFFTFYLISAKVGVSRVSGYSGGGLMIKCEHPQYKTKPKYICKESDGCSERKNPGVQDEWMENGDVYLYDDTRAGVLMVFFRELKAADAGTYRCGVNVSHYTERFTELQLNVTHDFSVIIIISLCVILLLIGGFTLTVWKIRHGRRDKLNVYKVSGYSGGGLMIKCEHPQYKTKPKYICKESDGCSERRNPGVQDEWMENGDVSLFDDTRAGVLMVFFRELKAADAGTYRCGVNVSHYTERFTELQLNIKHDAKYPKRVTESAHFDEEVSITCQIPEEHEVHFCKEDDNHICQNISSSKVTQMIGSSERNEERVFTVIISNVSVRDAGVYWCGAETRDTYLTFISLNTKIQLIVINFSMVIIISVCVILLLISGFTLTVWKLRHKRRGRIPTSDKKKRKKNTSSSCADSRHDSLSGPGSVQMNSNDDLPTIPSDGLLYTAVSFQRYEESLSDATVKFSKNEINSQYATVSHHMRLN
ncbi:polymeric immunoglobulin receptor-like protein [Labeo rohita]|nr:polymeric immunoglobulin receptor-like protein [Labeo rohita]